MRKTKSMTGAGLALVMILSSGAMSAAAQPTAMQPIVEDARSHLSAGFLKAGAASSNMQLLSNVPPVPGFSNPDFVEGRVVPPFPVGKRRGPTAGTAFANTDLAFFEHYVLMNNFHGFNIYDVASPESVKVVASVVCPGGGNDVSMWGHLVFVSIEEPRSRLDCGDGGRRRRDQQGARSRHPHLRHR